MIFWNGEEKKNNDVDVCRVVEGLKEKKKRTRMCVDIEEGRNKKKKK